MDSPDIELSAPLLGAAAEAGGAPSSPPATPTEDGSPTTPTPSTKAANAREGLRRAVRKVAAVRAVSNPTSAKGIPLLRRTSLAVLRNTVGASAHDDTISDRRMDLAASFVRDALANRSPNTRLAQAAGIGNNGGGGGARKAPVSAPSTPKPASMGAAGRGATVTGSINAAPPPPPPTPRPGRYSAGDDDDVDGPRHGCCSRPSLERLMSSWPYRVFMQLAVLIHCLLAYYEAVPPSTTTGNEFSWLVGVIELACLLIYAADQVMVIFTFGLHHYWDKRWEPVFLLITLCGWVDWSIYYIGGMSAVFRFSRPFRPLLGISKRKSLRRLLSSLLWTLPKMADISLLLLLALMFYATLGLHLFNRQQVPGYSPHDDNFNDWLNSVLAMFVLSTTENYPNVANQAYRHRPVVAALFFVSALFVILWLLLPLILATVYDHYKDVHARMVRAKRVKQYVSLVFAYQVLLGDGDREMDRRTFTRLVQRLRPLDEQEAALLFSVLDADDSGLITVAEFLRLPSVLKLAIDRSQQRDQVGHGALSWLRATSVQVVGARWFWWATLASILVTCAMGAVWTVKLQEDYDNCICQPQTAPALDDNTPSFVSDADAGAGTSASASLAGLSAGVQRTLSEVLGYGSMAMAAVGLPVPAPSLSSEYKSSWQGVLGAGTGASGERSRVVFDPATGMATGGGAGVGAPATGFSAFVNDPSSCVPGSAVACAANPVRWSSYIALIALLLQWAEIAMRSLAHRTTSVAAAGTGWARYWVTASTMHTVDTLVVFWSTISYFAFIVGAKETAGANDWFDLFEIGRALPFLRVITHLRRLRRIMATVGSIIGLVVRFTIVYAGISYAFVIVGMGIFGAVTQPEGQALCQQCQLYAMDTFPRAWLAILQVSVGNNWNSIFYPLITAVGTRWAAVFWVAYRFFMTDILMNIIEGVMLEAYSRYDEQKEDDSNMQRLEDVQQRSAAAAASTGSYGGGGGGGGGSSGSAAAGSGSGAAGAGRVPLSAVAEEPSALSLAGGSASVATAGAPGRVPPLPPGPKPTGAAGSTAPRLALRRQRELFDEISAAEEDVRSSRPAVPPPPPARVVRPSGVGIAMTAAAGGAVATAAPPPPARAGSGLGAALLGSSDSAGAAGAAEPDSRRRNSIYGVTQEELAMLEKALRRHEAAIATDTDSLSGSVPEEASFAVGGSLAEEV